LVTVENQKRTVQKTPPNPLAGAVRAAARLALGSSQIDAHPGVRSARAPRRPHLASLAHHQPPEVNYWAVLTFGEIKQEVHSHVYPAGEIDFFENLDIVHFWWLVASCSLLMWSAIQFRQKSNTLALL
jgi:hypothetical protein